MSDDTEYRYIFKPFANDSALSWGALGLLAFIQSTGRTVVSRTYLIGTGGPTDTPAYVDTLIAECIAAGYLVELRSEP